MRTKPATESPEVAGFTTIGATETTTEADENRHRHDSSSVTFGLLVEGSREDLESWMRKCADSNVNVVAKIEQGRHRLVVIEVGALRGRDQKIRELRTEITRLKNLAGSSEALP